MVDKSTEQPVCKLDMITPQPSSESPQKETPREAPLEDQPPEVEPDQGDVDNPGRGPDEVTAPIE